MKTEEIKGFLVKELQDAKFEPRANLALNKTISQMWSTYGGEVFVGETFGDIVNALHKSPPSKALTDAIRQTPKAILTGREAVKDGRAKSYESAIQKEYFKGIVPHGVTAGTIDYLVANTDRVRELCPAIAVEHCLTRIRQTEEFVPEESDAADLQHATVAVAYCDFLCLMTKCSSSTVEELRRQLGSIAWFVEILPTFRSSNGPRRHCCLRKSALG